MYTKNGYPGKFQGNRSQLLAEVAYTASLDGCNRELGDVDGFGWYGYLHGNQYRYIIHEDSQGFVTVDHGSPVEMDKDWQRIEADYAEYCESEHAEEAEE